MEESDRRDREREKWGAKREDEASRRSLWEEIKEVGLIKI